jgi:hypothetical protein
MIQLSEIAAMALLASLQAGGVEFNKGLRLKQEDRKFTLHIDTPGENDRITWQSKTPLLIVDQDLEAEIGDMLVDVEERGEENRLVIRRTIAE